MACKKKRKPSSHIQRMLLPLDFWRREQNKGERGEEGGRKQPHRFKE